jgi:CRP-like cAMP-binding protein
MNFTYAPPLANEILAALPQKAFATLEPKLCHFSVEAEVMLLEAGQEIEEVFFPVTGMVTLLIVMKDGATVETGKFGCDGVAGASAGCFGRHISGARVATQIATTGYKVAATHLRKAATKNPSLSRACLKFEDSLLAQARLYAARYNLATVEALYCRWLIDAAKYCPEGVLPFTQLTISKSLNVRRTSVTGTAAALRAAEIIDYSRGRIRILDPIELRKRACD